MNRKTVPVEDAAEDWFNDPEFVAEFEALKTEFAIAEALIRTSEEIDQMREPRTRGARRFAPCSAIE
ncbi:hypothetical protein RFM68_05200 [Mesorhizobium sp. MSK_1335]|uniref:Uncharacterized protein n=1 Tax=Mesorhizobium montanum TaxID=3072323 RepID=A0ABU4ZEW5_9HYPH|nr:hypothetical protein [Mesorhizobium sp. MSK_1335]MDX8523896.1 hypothetical protein [Mesorhizobium sp. MSK_1335]